MGLLDAHKAMASKTAVVIGGAAGHLGRGTTLGLAREGVKIIVCDNDREGLETILGEVAALGTGATVTPIYGDVMDPASFDAFWDQVETLTDSIDILVNVPGGVARMLFEKTSRQNHADNIRYNYGYHIDSCHRALPLLKKSGKGGSIVNFTDYRGASRRRHFRGLCRGQGGTDQFQPGAGCRAGAACYPGQLPRQRHQSGTHYQCRAGPGRLRPPCRMRPGDHGRGDEDLRADEARADG